MDIRGTPDQQLIYLNTHWGSHYDFATPKDLHDKWTAKAKFGNLDELREDTSTDLLRSVRTHYQANTLGTV